MQHLSRDLHIHQANLFKLDNLGSYDHFHQLRVSTSNKQFFIENLHCSAASFQKLRKIQAKRKGKNLFYHNVLNVRIWFK